MEQLIDDLLEYSRSTHAATSDESASVNEAVSAAVDMLRDQINKTGAVITCEVEDASVRADRAQLAQLFQNLVSNSLKYRNPAESPRIWIRTRRETDTWLVSVSDNGIGFDQSYANGIFRLFKRLHGQDYPGTGVGLAICKRVVERFGGEIWAESTLGQGSTFYIRLRASDRRATTATETL
jgi:light-regulated signal transduction histidine kinase (bacteriophytochrome)